MVEIKDLLGRFKNLLLSEEFKIEAIGKILSETIGIKINKQKIKIKNGVVYLDIKPIYKNEIFIKQEQILSRFKESFGKNPPTGLL